MIHTTVSLLDTIWAWKMFKFTFSHQHLYEFLGAPSENIYLYVLWCVGIFLVGISRHSHVSLHKLKSLFWSLSAPPVGPLGKDVDSSQFSRVEPIYSFFVLTQPRNTTLEISHLSCAHVFGVSPSLFCPPVLENNSALQVITLEHFSLHMK